jgi:hypothetical protein
VIILVVLLASKLAEIAMWGWTVQFEAAHSRSIVEGTP